jgi:tetratricopeptide (TPR) repeat protein
MTHRGGRLEAALVDYSHAIEMSAEPYYYFERAWTYREAHFRQDFSESLPSSQIVLEAAITDFSKAIELNPEDPGFYFERGATYRELGDREAALADFNQAIQLKSNDPYWFVLPRDLPGDGRPEAALVDHNRAI